MESPSSLKVEEGSRRVDVRVMMYGEKVLMGSVDFEIRGSHEPRNAGSLSELEKSSRRNTALMAQYCSPATLTSGF